MPLFEFPSNIFWNASGIALTWMNSGGRRVLGSTGVAGFPMHFGPVTSRLQFRVEVFGAKTLWQAVCDYQLSINPGDMIVLTSKRGQTLNTLEFYSVEGIEPYPSLYLPHQVLLLAKFQQN